MCGATSSSFGILLGFIIIKWSNISRAGLAQLRIVMWNTYGKSPFLTCGGESRKKEIIEFSERKKCLNGFLVKTSSEK